MNLVKRGEDGLLSAGAEKKDGEKEGEGEEGGGGSGGGVLPLPVSSAPPLSPRTASQQPQYGYYPPGNGPRVVGTDQVMFRKYTPSAGTVHSPRGKSPRVVSTDEVYYNRWRPSSHENRNVSTPVYFVTQNDPTAPARLNAANTNVNSWSYVPRHSAEWEVRRRGMTGVSERSRRSAEINIIRRPPPQYSNVIKTPACRTA